MTQHEVKLGFFPHFPFSFFSPVCNTEMCCQKLSFSEEGISLDSAKKASPPELIILSSLSQGGKKPHLLALFNLWLEVVFY